MSVLTCFTICWALRPICAVLRLQLWPSVTTPVLSIISLNGETIRPGQCALLDGEELDFGGGDKFLLARKSLANSR